MKRKRGCRCTNCKVSGPLRLAGFNLYERAEAHRFAKQAIRKLQGKGAKWLKPTQEMTKLDDLLVAWYEVDDALWR